MAIRQYKPTSAGRRFQSVLEFTEITKKEPERRLLAPKQRTGGRNALGRMTSRHRGGGHKQRYRIVDFRRDKDLVPAKVAAIEYDPNRSARLALLNYVDGEKRYILAPVGLRIGDSVAAGEGADIKPGNAMPLRQIPTGTMVHNIELKPGRGGTAGAQRRGVGAADGERGLAGAAEAPVGRAALRAARRAGPPSVRSATSTMRTSRSAKPGATVGAASARMCVAWR